MKAIVKELFENWKQVRFCGFDSVEVVRCFRRVEHKFLRRYLDFHDFHELRTILQGVIHAAEDDVFDVGMP